MTTPEIRMQRRSDEWIIEATTRMESLEQAFSAMRLQVLDEIEELKQQYTALNEATSSEISELHAMMTSHTTNDANAFLRVEMCLKENAATLVLIRNDFAEVRGWIAFSKWTATLGRAIAWTAKQLGPIIAVGLLLWGIVLYLTGKGPFPH